MSCNLDELAGNFIEGRELAGALVASLSDTAESDVQARRVVNAGREVLTIWVTDGPAGYEFEQLVDLPGDGGSTTVHVPAIEAEERYIRFKTELLSRHAQQAEKIAQVGGTCVQAA